MATNDLSLDLKPEEDSEEYTSESEEYSDELPMKSPVAALVLGGSNNAVSYDDESNIHDDITLVLEFPDGVKKDITCKTGETVNNLKKKLFDEFEIPFSCTISYENKVMLDPLSLNDFPDLIAASKNGKTNLKITV